MLLDFDVFKLEDNQDYLIVGKVLYNNQEYCLLSEVGNEKNICFRKIVEEDNKKYLSTISKEEYDIVVKLFNNLGELN